MIMKIIATLFMIFLSACGGGQETTETLPDGSTTDQPPIQADALRTRAWGKVDIVQVNENLGNLTIELAKLSSDYSGPEALKDGRIHSYDVINKTTFNLGQLNAVITDYMSSAGADKEIRYHFANEVRVQVARTRESLVPAADAPADLKGVTAKIYNELDRVMVFLEADRDQ